MTDSQKFLTEYVKDGAETAFRELVAGYFDLVYCTARRLVGGDTHLAEDVAQTVFVDLARSAKKLSREVSLAGWLHRHTCFVAANALRGERRRQARETQAFAMNAQPDDSEARLSEVAPILDEAINHLAAADRAAVLLRFYEHLDFRSVAQAMGTNEAAAQKRVSRALEKLQILLKHRGIAFSTAALGTVLAAGAVTAAPVGLAAGVAGTAFASAAAGTGTALTFLEIMAASKLKTGIITALIAASLVTPLLLQRQAQASQRGQEDALRRQTNELAEISSDNQRLAELLARGTNSPKPGNAQFLEVLRLRGEVGRLTREAGEMAPPEPPATLSREEQLATMKKMYAARVDRLKQWLEEHPAEKIPELKLVSDATWVSAAGDLVTEADFARAARSLRANAEGPVFDVLWPALRKYGRENNGQFPAELAELKPYFKSPIDEAILQRYAILPANSLAGELQPGGDWVITEKAPVNAELDPRMAYGLTNMRSADERVTNRWTLVR